MSAISEKLETLSGKVRSLPKERQEAAIEALAGIAPEPYELPAGELMHPAASSDAHCEPAMPARHPGKRHGVYPGSRKMPASAYETIPDNALRGISGMTPMRVRTSCGRY